MAHFHHFSMFNQNQSISILVIFGQNTKKVIAIAVAARVFATLIIYVFMCTELVKITPVDRWKVVCKYRMSNVQNGGKCLLGKAWLKDNLSKSARKRSHRRVAYAIEHEGMDPF